ncbi:MAG TPA: spore germination protein GerW family protein [Armatimonadota bacterium]|nr:spore germination protein GerW family protein [Armatimonadota bacterium]HOM72856.1 spore germination protein GerW family protein [Armatimonadota bacterium]HPP73850.1 spore germination protein GerW family protein [Armatimonadota bacterium]
MIAKDLIKSITDKLSMTTQVNAVFGEPQTVGKKTIIPIATVNMGFGAGGGEGKQAKDSGEPTQEGAGGGGGGSGSAKPLAILEVTEESTKLIPVIDVTRIVVASLTFAAVTTYLITKFLSKR